LPNANHPVQAVNDALASYLKAQASLNGLTVLTEWPTANQKLTYPSVSIFANTPAGAFMALPPEQVTATAPDVNNVTTVTFVVGEWDYKIQLDVWARNKPERDAWLGKVKDAINAAMADATTSSFNPMGLSLTLTNYFNEIARLDVEGAGYVQDERAAQVEEWRGKIDLLVNVREIRQRTMYAIKTIQVAQGMNTDGSNFGDDTAGTETIVVPPLP
jgi:hypothetical protein